MATYNLGRILPIFRGIWDSTVQYEKLDIVYWNSNSWVATGSSLNSEPTDDNTDWICVARGGKYADWSDDDKEELNNDIMEGLGTTINLAINQYITNSLSQDNTIQNWMDIITMPQSEYDALTNKSGTHFVYSDD